jgi:hypothetical protein
MSHKILQPGYERNDERGMFSEVLNEGHWEGLLRGRMHSGAVLGNHYHKQTVIFFFISRGSAEIKTINVESGDRDHFQLQTGHGVMLAVNESHSIRFLEESEFIMLKSRHYDAADPDTFHFPVED